MVYHQLPMKAFMTAFPSFSRTPWSRPSWRPVATGGTDSQTTLVTVIEEDTMVYGVTASLVVGRWVVVGMPLSLLVITKSVFSFAVPLGTKLKGRIMGRTLDRVLRRLAVASVVIAALSRGTGSKTVPRNSLSVQHWTCPNGQDFLKVI